MSKRSHRDEPKATRAKSRPSVPSDSSRPFNAFRTEHGEHGERSREGQSDRSRDKKSRRSSKVVLRSNSERRQDRSPRNDKEPQETPNAISRHQDLTDWKTLTLPSQSHHIPDWARSETSSAPFSTSSGSRDNPAPQPPLSIVYRNNGDRCVNVHGAPPEDQRNWFLDVIHALQPAATTYDYETRRPTPTSRTKALSDVPPNPQTTTPRLEIPQLQLPNTAGHMSDSTTDTDGPPVVPPRAHLAQYDLQWNSDGSCTIGIGENAIHIDFVPPDDRRNFRLLKCTTWVRWAQTQIVEYKHYQSTQPGLQTVWCSDPYCWLVCPQLQKSCSNQSSKDDFWFRLWHYLDHLKLEANARSNRLFAAHEITNAMPLPHLPLDDNRRQKIIAKIQQGSQYPNIVNWSDKLQLLEEIFTQWPDWEHTVEFIIPHQDGEHRILMVFYKWRSNDARSYVNNRDEVPILHTIPWGHATDFTSGLQILNTGGIRPAAIVDEQGCTYHWCPSFYCRIHGKLLDVKVDHKNYITHAQQTIIHCRKRTTNTVKPFTFHGITYARHHHITISNGGTSAEFTASLFFDVVHGHQHRWLVKCHVSELMGFAI